MLKDKIGKDFFQTCYFILFYFLHGCLRLLHFKKTKHLFSSWPRKMPGKIQSKGFQKLSFVIKLISLLHKKNMLCLMGQLALACV